MKSGKVLVVEIFEVLLSSNRNTSDDREVQGPVTRDA